MENSSQDVSPFAAMEARVGVVEVWLIDMTSEGVIDGAGDESSGNRDLKEGEASSGVVTEDDDGDGGMTIIG